MKQFKIILVVIVIVVIAIIVIRSQSSGQPAVPSDNSIQSTVTDQSPADPISSHIVSLTSKGFSPSKITIKVGDTVTFVNNSMDQMWVASNPHPTHTDLPGFDEKGFVVPGQYWNYTFTVTGSHGYHNHANPTMKGLVVVE